MWKRVGIITVCPCHPFSQKPPGKTIIHTSKLIYHTPWSDGILLVGGLEGRVVACMCQSIPHAFLSCTRDLNNMLVIVLIHVLDALKFNDTHEEKGSGQRHAFFQKVVTIVLY